MTWLVLIVLFILLLILGRIGLKEFLREIIFGKSTPKQDVVRSYHISKPVFIKWMEVLHPELWLQLKSRKQSYSPLELFFIYGALGEPVLESLIISKRDLQSHLSISSKTLKKHVQKHLQEIGLTMEQYEKLNVFPPRIAEGVVKL